MIRAMSVLLVCQLLGTVFQEASGLPLPGAVLGLVMLLAYFIRTGGPSPVMRETANGLLKYLGLLFVPAGVGVVTELQAIRDNALAIAVAIPVSTIVALVVTGVLMNWFVTRRRADA
jgi:holin-like protein